MCGLKMFRGGVGEFFQWVQSWKFIHSCSQHTSFTNQSVVIFKESLSSKDDFPRNIAREIKIYPYKAARGARKRFKSLWLVLDGHRIILHPPRNHLTEVCHATSTAWIG